MALSVADSSKRGSDRSRRVSSWRVSRSTHAIDDLEDELIRAVGAERVLDIVEERGERVPFRTLQKQPEWRGRPIEQQLRRFLGNSSRKIGYAPRLVEALDLSKVPRPLDAVLAHV